MSADRGRPEAHAKIDASPLFSALHAPAGRGVGEARGILCRFQTRRRFTWVEGAVTPNDPAASMVRWDLEYLITWARRGAKRTIASRDREGAAAPVPPCVTFTYGRSRHELQDLPQVRPG
jgi:hypothetical protein